MHLYKKTYVQNWEHYKPENRFDVSVKRGGITYPNVKPERIVYVIEQVGYWRKFHSLNQWFFTKSDSVDSREFYVGRETLIELLNLLKLQKENPNEEILDGFDIDNEWFEQQIEETIPMLEGILSEDDSDDFLYSASW